MLHIEPYCLFSHNMRREVLPWATNIMPVFRWCIPLLCNHTRQLRRSDLHGISQALLFHVICVRHVGVCSVRAAALLPHAP